MEKIPLLALGTWKSPKDKVTEAVRYAVEEAGYRHFDRASDNGNEPEIGVAIKDLLSRGVVKREELWITAKLWNQNHHAEDVEVECRQTLKDLQIDYIDLYIMHWPLSFQKTEGEYFPKDKDGNILFDNTVDVHETWKAMEKLVKRIGVSNFNIELLEKVLHYEDLQIKPFCDQVECRLYLQQEALREFCEKRGIIVGGYSALGSADFAGSPVLLKDTLLNEVAKEVGKTAAQTEIQFLYQLDPTTWMVAKSVTPPRIKENNTRSFELNNDQMERLKARNRCYRYCDSHPVWYVTVFGDHF